MSDSPTVSRLTRRQLLKRLSLLSGAAVILPVLDACSPPVPAAPAAQPATAAATAAQGAAKVGGEIRFGQNNEPDSLDPARTGQASSHTVMMNVFDTLIWLDPADNKFKPGLAESWDSTPDGLTFTFKLRKGVKFHDGTPFNADAVKFTFDRPADPALKSPVALDKLGPYQETKVIDDNTAQVILKAPYPGFLDSVSQTWLGIVSPAAVKKYGNDFGRNPVGTGFMKFKEWVAKDHITLERNADYNWGPPFWNHSGPAYLDRLTFVPVAENGARLTAFESGDLTIIEAVPEADFDRLKKSGKYQMKVSPSQGCPMTFYMNTQKSPTSDINVRKAILYGLNRKELIDTALFGFYTPAEGPLSPNTLYYSKKVEGLYPYDLAKAKSLLDDAGWKVGADGIREKDGQKLSLDFVNWPPAQPMVITTQALLKPLGMQVNVKIFDQATRIAMAEKGDGHLFSTGQLDTEPGAIRFFYYSKNIGSDNWSRYSDPEMDSWLDKQQIEPDPAKRAQLLENIQLKVMQNALCYPAYVFARLHGVNAKVQNFRVNALGSYPYFYEMWLA